MTSGLYFNVKILCQGKILCPKKTGLPKTTQIKKKSLKMLVMVELASSFLVTLLSDK